MSAVSELDALGMEITSSELDAHVMQDALQYAADLRESLKPSAVAIQHAFLRQYDPAKRDGKHLVRVTCDKGDRGIVEDTIRTSFAIHDAGTDGTNVGFVSAHGKAKDPLGRFDLSLVEGYVASCDIILVLDEIVPQATSRFFDAEVDLTSLDAVDISQALRGRYGEAVEVEPWRIWPRGIPFSLLDFAIAKSRDAAEAISFVERMAPASPAVLSRSSGGRVPLDDLLGYGEAKSWAERFVADVDMFRAGRLPWREVDSTLLLVGPPGTGKTEFAKRVADAVGIPIVATSYAAWQRSGEGHLGDVTKAIHEAFATARSAAPSVLFIDEIDSLPARSAEKRNASWYAAVVNALLEEIDGLAGRDGVAVVAACNDDSKLDPALTRSGRLAHPVAIELPDAAALSGILAAKLGGAIPREALRPICETLEGTATGADVARIAMQAKRTARVAGRAIEIADVEAATMPPDARPEAERRIVAVHEAGHVVVALASGVIPRAASLVASGVAAGAVHYDRSAATASALTLHRDIVVMLAGRAAEEIVIGSISAGSGGDGASDLANATRMAAWYEGAYGFGSSLVYQAQPEHRLVETIVRRAYADAVALVVRHRAEVSAFAELLLASRVVGRERVVEFASRHNLLPTSAVTEAEVAPR